MIKKIFAITLFALAVVACQKVPVTGRSQLSILPASQVNQMALQSYNQFLDENKTNVLPQTNSASVKVKTIGEKIRDAVITHARQENYYDRIKDFQWEFHTVEDKTVNAWCMPGGKVVVYTGILPVTVNDDALAIVMGHEIAHAVAGHGGERMSQTLAVQMGLSLAQIGSTMSSKPSVIRDVALQAAGTGSQIGLLAFSRQHESEADKIGLIYATMAGYNPEEAVPFWQRMAALNTGQKPPEILSTHPSDERRIADLQRIIPEVKAKYGKK
jgi:predicted Zn-dependent protease